MNLQERLNLRAASRCEYCRMHQELQGGTFHVEHILPISHGGSSQEENLAWACPRCNLLKSDRVTGIDPSTGAEVALFHPRRQAWHEHFAWNGYIVEAITACGRATIATLDLNHARRIRIRQAEELIGLFPPAETR